MRNRWIKFFVFSALTLLVASGCATTRARRAEVKSATPAVDPQVAALQSELQAKDQQIQELQAQIQSRAGANYNQGASGGKSSKIHVSGVSVSDVQAALAKAGFDPGPTDGKMGKKTKAALKAFQRAHGLKADGVIGDKTWKLLQA